MLCHLESNLQLPGLERVPTSPVSKATICRVKTDSTLPIRSLSAVKHSIDGVRYGIISAQIVRVGNALEGGYISGNPPKQVCFV